MNLGKRVKKALRRIDKDSPIMSSFAAKLLLTADWQKENEGAENAPRDARRLIIGFSKKEKFVEQNDFVTVWVRVSIANSELLKPHTNPQNLFQLQKKLKLYNNTTPVWRQILLRKTSLKKITGLLVWAGTEQNRPPICPTKESYKDHFYGDLKGTCYFCTHGRERHKPSHQSIH